MTIISTFRGVRVIYYSYEEWKNTEEWDKEWALAFFCQADRSIHLLQDLESLRKDEECPDEFKDLTNDYVERILLHEYVHYLQWKLGKELTHLPILPKGKVPITNFIKNVYPSQSWELEAEARWIELRPNLIEEIEAIVESSL